VIGELDYRLPVTNFVSDNPAFIRFGIKAFYIDRFRTQTSGASPVIEAAGTVGTPRWRLNGRLGFNFDPIDFDVQVLWNSSVVGDRDLTIEDTPINEYGDYTTVNTTLGFRVNDSFRMQLSVRNLFDVGLPFAATVTRNFSVFDPIGRTFSATGTVTF
jgi:outer membrane receptor protein involved in Fe transport